jgi:hypothetical protein
VVVVSVTMPVTIPWMTKTLLRETVCHSDQEAISMRAIAEHIEHREANSQSMLDHLAY